MPRHKSPDRLTQCAAEAIALGMSYGQYMAQYHPDSPPRQPDKPKPVGEIRRVCLYCGAEFTQYDRRPRKYCCEGHRNACNKQMYRDRRHCRLAAKPTKKERICAICVGQSCSHS